MPDEDVIAGTGEQAPAEGGQADVTDAGGAEADAERDATGDGAAAVEGAVPAVDETPQSEFETLDAVWERYPALREQHEATLAEERRVAENAGAQRREQQLKREAGQQDVTRRNVARFLQDTGIEVEDPSRLDYLYSLAAANSAYELAQALPDAALRNYSIPVETREKALQARESGDWDGYLATLVNGAVEVKDAERQRLFDTKVTAEVNKRLAGEIKARGLEKAPVRDPMPATPVGSASRGGPTPEEYAGATRTQRAQWRREGVNPVVA